MRAVRIFAPRDLRIVEADKPRPKPHEALVRVECVGVCGSDLHYYTDGGIGNTRITDPLILGHEYAGVVEEVGEEADPSLVGKRVAVEPGIPCLKCESCQTGHYNVCTDMFFPGLPPNEGVLCEYATVHAGFCFPVPDSLDEEAAAIVEPLAVAVHTVELANLKPGETAAVLGLGPIGLLTAEVARLSGAGVVYGTDLLDYRVAAGLEHGCDETFNAARADSVDAIMDATGGRGVDVAFDCAKSSDTISIACKVARPAGRCIITGISGKEDDMCPVTTARRKELTLQWCRRFRYDYPRTIRLLASGRINVRPLLTHRFPLEKTAEAFELLARNAEDVLKVSVLP